MDLLNISCSYIGGIEMCIDLTEDSKAIVIKFGYLIGVRKEIFINSFVGYEEEVREKLEEINKNENARIVRYLSKCRNTLFLNWSAINKEIRNNRIQLSDLNYFDRENLDFLKKYNVLNFDTSLIDSAKAVCEVSLAIQKYIDYLKDLFPE